MESDASRAATSSEVRSVLRPLSFLIFVTRALSASRLSGRESMGGELTSRAMFRFVFGARLKQNGR